MGQENTLMSIYYSKSNTIKNILDALIVSIPTNVTDIVILCIGTDRSTGDSLGPLTGTILSQSSLQHLFVYGRLDNPVHAQNLNEIINQIKMDHQRPYIIAIDASLGKSSSIGNLNFGNGPIFPGAALKKDLPPVGNLHLTGIVNIAGFMEFNVLQNTRLSLVYQMSHVLSAILLHLDHWLDIYSTNKSRKHLKVTINKQLSL